MPRKTKLNNKTVSVGDEKFDSVREYRRFQELKLLELAGEITDLRRQVKFTLIPAQYEEVETDEVYKVGPKKGHKKKIRVCIERECAYIADFVYFDKYGKRIVEDSKGFRRTNSAVYGEFVIKRKMMLYLNGIKVHEV